MDIMAQHKAFLTQGFYVPLEHRWTKYMIKTKKKDINLAKFCSVTNLLCYFSTLFFEPKWNPSCKVLFNKTRKGEDTTRKPKSKEQKNVG